MLMCGGTSIDYDYWYVLVVSMIGLAACIALHGTMCFDNLAHEIIRTSIDPGTYSRCHFKGDGDCDDQNNNARCDWDGGDCCASTSRRGYVSKRYCDEVGCE